MPAEKLDRVRVVECVEMEESGLEEEVDEMVRESLFRVGMFKQKLNLRELAPQGQGWESTIAKGPGLRTEHQSQW